MKINYLDWDSNFFSLNVGEIFLQNSEESFQTEDFDVIYVKQNENTELPIKGFQKTFQETKVIFQKLFDLENTQQESFKIIDFDEFPVENSKLYELAYISGNHSRFLLDEKFGKEKFKKLYRMWIDNSINKKFAKKIFYIEQENNILGFVTLQVNDNSASIGLIAVDTSTQGKGLGKQLIAECETYCKKNNISELKIPTQKENIQACNFYKKNGYHMLEKITIKHYWKN